MDFEALKEKFEAAIRLGEINPVQRELEALKAAAIPRVWLADFADIARRVRMENWGLRLLRPIVRAEPPVHPPASENELCVYAGLLIKVGALPEAQEILEKLDEKKIVNVSTFLSQIHIAQWNYREAAVILQKIIKRKDITPYQRCVAQVNLTGAFIFLQKFREAEESLAEISEACRSHGWDLLYGNSLELSAQLAVSQRNWSEASRLLKEAETRAGQHSHYLIFIEKWRSIAELMQASDSSQSDQAQRKIEIVRAKAQSLNSWESVRDLDYHVALHLKHQNLLLNVYFGTPFQEYKKRIELIFKEHNWKIPNHYFRKLSTAPATRVLDLETGLEADLEMKETLKPGQMLYRLLNILALDFYKPVGLGELFSKLFPEEYFHPDAAADRIHQAVKLLRKWFQANQIPLDVFVENNRYSVMAQGPYAFKISKKSKDSKELVEAGFDLQIQRLKSKWPYQSFSVAKAATELEISVSSVRSLLQRALDENLLYKSGAGRSTLYHFQK